MSTYANVHMGAIHMEMLVAQKQNSRQAVDFIY